MRYVLLVLILCGGFRVAKALDGGSNITLEEHRDDRATIAPNRIDWTPAPFVTTGPPTIEWRVAPAVPALDLDGLAHQAPGHVALSASAVYLDSGDVLSVKGCRIGSTPLGESDVWWTCEPDDRARGRFVVRASGVLAVVMQ